MAAAARSGDLPSTEDRLAVLDLYARQSHAIDGGDAAGWAATFTPGGSFESPTYRLVATGTAELTAFAADSNSAALARGEQLRHWISAVVLSHAGEDALAAQAYLLIIATSSAGSRIDRSVRLVDDLRRVDGEWLVTRRKVLRDG
ncbi:MAG TPA: nuclear transport factor 2 family protein [Amycolatopsis sp.]|nr:nuclear transport factor 2 family protein [Amycolatopsis sp.]